jgi:predicted transglutaminase-like cysteine proteinase
VNRRIFAEITPGNGATEKWAIAPPTGDCKDYAVTKRHTPLTRGWPSRALLLSEVVLPSGEHHLLLVVRVKEADLVLDNLGDDIRLAATTYDQYGWLRIQSPQNPKFWLRVRGRDAVQTAMLSNELPHN